MPSYAVAVVRRRPVTVTALRGTREAELEQLKNRLLRRTLDDAETPDLYEPLRRVANEAAALAWATPFPLLFLPALLEEKAAQARIQTAKQKSIWALTRVLFAVAA